MAVRTVYRGTLGATRKEQLHVTCVCGAIMATEAYRCVDVGTHPDLAARLVGRDALNTAKCPQCGESSLIHVPLLYHDPAHHVFVLMLPDSERHRELAARAALLLELDSDVAPVPAYVRDFDLVFGVAGLQRLLRERTDKHAQDQRDAEHAQEVRRMATELDDQRLQIDARLAEIERARAEMARREQEIARNLSDMEHQRETLARREQELAHQRDALERREHELNQRTQDLERKADDMRATQGVEPRAAVTEQVATLNHPGGDKTQLVANPLQAVVQVAQAKPTDKTQIVAVDAHHSRTTEHASPFDFFEPDDDEPDESMMSGTTRSSEVSHVTELDASEAIELVEGEVVITDVPIDMLASASEPAIGPWIESGEPAAVFMDASGCPRLAITANRHQLDMLAAPRLDLRLQLHCLPSFPVIALAVGSSESFSSGSTAPAPLAVPMNMDDAKHHAVLERLARSFTLEVDVYDSGYTLLRKLLVVANLEDNASYVLERAKEHLDSISPRERSLSTAIAKWAHRDYDRFGWQHRERSEFREDKLTDLSSAQTVRRALAIADRFSKPEREDYLFMVRGYPVSLWTRQRREVLERAIELGIWLGKRLAAIAVEEGLASDYQDLVARMQKNFARFQKGGSPAYDLDPDAASDNWVALEGAAEELRVAPAEVGKHTRSLGKKSKRKPRATPIASSATPHVSGTIGSNPRAVNAAQSPRNLATDELIARLNNKTERVAAAIELARRREPRAVDLVMECVADMSRNDAVRVLGAVPSFGDLATHALIVGLANHKGFIRQGCGLALAVLKNEAALEALSDQVISEPTAIWKELARGIGTVGPSAIMPLVSRLSKNDHGAHERVAWALAHIAARGGKRQVSQLANGRNPLAASVAKNALELASHAKRDDLQVRGARTPKEQTVNRAFSRTFFQALESSAPVVAPATTVDLSGDLSSPAMLLDEADLLETNEYDSGEDAEELLDESDLIPT